MPDIILDIKLREFLKQVNISALVHMRNRGHGHLNDTQMQPYKHNSSNSKNTSFYILHSVAFVKAIVLPGIK